MSHLFFFGADGSPLTGKAPLQLRLSDDVTPTQRSAALNLANLFLQEVRLGNLSQLRRTAFTHGARVEMSYLFGITSVSVEAAAPTAGERNEPEFYGGLLLCPSYYVSDSEYTLLPEVKSSGKTDVKPGRPAVPGTKPSDATDWLVVQISKTMELTPTPIKRGAIKVFRIKEPLFGSLVECSETAGKYLLSANSTLTEFYLCGRRVPSIPAVPWAAASHARYQRLRTINFVPESFAKAANTKGIVVLAADDTLYAIDTRKAAPAWQQLAFAAPVPNPNEFGSSAAVTRLTGATKVQYYGANAAGPCSNFSITIEDETQTLTGEITLVDDNTTAGVSTVLHSYSVVLNYNGTANSSTSPDFIAYWYRDPGSGAIRAATFQTTGLVISASGTYNVVDSTAEGLLPRSYDRFTGVLSAPLSTGLKTQTTTYETTGSHLGWNIVSNGLPPLFGGGETPYMRNHIYEFYQYESQVVVSGAIERGTLITAEDDYVTSESDAQTLYSRVNTVKSSLPADPRFADQNSGRIFSVGQPDVQWRRKTSRIGTRTAQKNESLRTTDSRGYPLSAQVDNVSSRLPQLAWTECERLVCEPLNIDLRLERRGGAQLVRFPDNFVRIGGRTKSAGLRTFYRGADWDAMSPLDRTSPTGVVQVLMPSHRFGDYVITPSAAFSKAHSYAYWVPFSWAGPGGEVISLPPGYGASPSLPGVSVLSVSWARSGPVSETFPLMTFAATMPLSQYANATWRANNSLLVPDTVSVTLPGGPVLAEPYTDGFCPLPSTPDLGGFEQLAYDRRVRGFVASSYLRGYFEATATWTTALDQYVGNDLGMISLRSVLEEWMGLGSSAGIPSGQDLLMTDPKKPMGAL